MPPPRNPERLVLSVLLVLGLCGLGWFAWSAVGWFGVGLLGLFVLFVAVRMDLEDSRPIGPQMTSGLHAEQYRHEARDRAERAGRTAERRAVRSAAHLAGLCGGALAIGGFGLFFLL